MKLQHTRREIKSIDLLPLINVVFLLILFVLVAGRPTTNHPQQIEVARSKVDMPYEATGLSVWLRSDDQFYLTGETPLTLGELAAHFSEKQVGEQGLTIELVADRRAHAKALLDFRQAMARAGVGEIRIKTEFYDNGEGPQ
jgi:biopolymer transport protein ExbD